MFLETAAAMFGLGFLACLLFARAEIVRLRRQISDLTRQADKDRRDRQEAWQAGTYRGQLRRQHLGTPYINPAPTPFERLLADIDDHNGSRKAPELRVVSS